MVSIKVVPIRWEFLYEQYQDIGVIITLWDGLIYPSSAHPNTKEKKDHTYSLCEGKKNSPANRGVLNWSSG
jgi:hypothetical protein